MHEPAQERPGGTTTSPRRAGAPSERRQARAHAPLEQLGEWDEGDRGHDALETLSPRTPSGSRAAAHPTRAHGVVAVELLPRGGRRHGRRPRLGARQRLEVQLCGDAHVLNFGLWATPERNLSFDLRDFDETLPGPFEWDVKRLAPAWSWPPARTASSPSGPRWR